MTSSQRVRGRFRYLSHLYSLAGNQMSLRTLRGAVRYVLFLLAAARTVAEKVTILVFFAKFIVAHLASSSFRREDTPLRLQGTTYILGLRSLEIFTFDEILRDRVYDRDANFIPKAGWTVFDIGANVGLFALRQARRGACVYAFEPNPDCFRRLSAAATANRLADRLHMFRCAIGREPGRGVIAVPRGWSTLGSVTPDDSPDADVEITSLDRVVPSLDVSHVDLLKVDVEGAEVDVLCGATRTLPMVDRLIVEYHSAELRDRVDALLRDNGFVRVLEVSVRNAAEGAGVLYARRAAA